MSSCIQCKAPLSFGARVCPACRALQPVVEKKVIAAGATFDLGYGRVVFEARIGEGGMGVVWRGWLFHAPNGARAAEPPEPIALKVLRHQAQVRKDMRALFLNEADTLRRLLHPNIVRFHDLFEWSPDAPPVQTQGGGFEGRPSIVAHSLRARDEGRGSSAPPSDVPTSLVLAIEYVLGDTLADVIARHVARAELAGSGALPGMPFRRAWYYFEQLLGALAATHALGVVHRDIKPSNILIRQDGIVKLTDYGIARFAQPSGGAQVPTGGFAAGTGAYMSPEQVLSRPLDGRSDLYSAAIVLYEMLSGKTPFASEDDSEFILRNKQVEAAVPPIRTWLAQAPPAIDALFARALAKDPEYRFGNAIEMGNAFRIGLGLPETDQWRAQAAIAVEAVPSVSHVTPTSQATSQRRMATLRDIVVKGYGTMKMGGG